MAFASSTLIAQTSEPKKTLQVQQVVDKNKHDCKEHKDGQACTKPADQQCDDCKAKAAAAQTHECKKAEGQKCEKAEGMKHECKECMQKCEKAEGMKHECKKGEGHQCEKAEGMKHECKEGMQKCEKAEGQKHECKKGMLKEEKPVVKHDCKEHKDGQPCTKPADQQCDDCKAKAAKKD